jgi:sensor histidine kinase YesM
MDGLVEMPGIVQPERANNGVRSGVRSSLLYSGLQWGCWGLWFWAQASGEVLIGEVPWSQALITWGGSGLVALWLTHLLRATSKIQDWFALPTRPLLGRAAASVAIVSASLFAVSVVVNLSVYGTPVSRMYASIFHKLPVAWQLLNQFTTFLSTTMVWVALYFGFMSQRRRHRAELRQAQLNEALQAAELRLLKFQLNPHFLFNALNGVRALIADEPAKAQEAVTRLARTLRYTLAAGDAELVSFGREMEMVNDYLALEWLRLADRLDVVREIEPGVESVRIPALLMQTLVENAIKHGIAPLKHGGTLRISARIVGKQLLLEIGNPRPVDDDKEPTEGLGLRNASERLRLLFGPAAKLDLDLLDPARATAKVRLPV